MKLIPLTRGLFAKVDDEDFEFLNQWNWCVNGTPESGRTYAVRFQRTEQGTRKIVFMHRVILGAMGINCGDHKDGDRLNNQKGNLRAATKVQNGGNCSQRKTNTSGFKGVYWRKDINKWQAIVARKSFGFFTVKEEAAKAYDVGAIQRYGEFAKTNLAMGLYA